MARVHVVDDDPELLSLVTLALEEAGHEVHVFQDGRNALVALEHEPPDVLVLDMLMPVMDGIELIRAAQQLRPALPIIAISGGGFFGTPMYFLEVAQAFGATAVLRKPFRMAELVKLVASVAQDFSRAAPR